MKTSIQIAALLLTLTGLSVASAQPSQPSAKSTSIVMDCELSRMTWDDKANQRVVEKFAPESAKNVSVPVNTLDAGEMKGAEVKFVAQTPEGQIEFYGGVFANDMFGSMIQLTGHAGVTIPSRDLGITNSSLDVPFVKYDDPNTYINPIVMPGVRFSTGLKPDGAARAVYVGGCTLKVSVK